MLDVRMKDVCRICARELCGNQRRWIFHPASKLNLQVLLSHALGRELTRDGRGEFACSKCAFMLDRMYRFDTVIARVEALSLERLQRLLQEKHRLRHCIGGLYRKTNGEEGEEEGGVGGVVDMSGLTHAKYCALLQDDLVYSLYESWAEEGLEVGGHHHHAQCSAGSEVTVGSQHCTPRRCRGCLAWRVADADYEAVCKVPRKLARSISCGPSTRYSSVIGGSAMGGGGGRGKEEEPPSSFTLVPSSKPPSRASDSERTLVGRASSSPSMESLEIAGELPHRPAFRDGDAGPGFHLEVHEDQTSDSLLEEPLGGLRGPRSASRLSLALCLAHSCAPYRPVLSPKGSRLPVLHRQSPSNGAPRLGFSEPELGVAYGGLEGEGEIHDAVADLEAPLIRLEGELDQAELEELWDDVYAEYPPPPPHQTLIEEQQTQLDQYECAAGQCVCELQKAQQQVQSLQNKMHQSEANNTKLQEKLAEMEVELREVRQAAQLQERSIQDLTDSFSTKDRESQELYQVIEGQNATLCKLREMAHHRQITHTQSQAPEGGAEAGVVARLQAELVGVQSSLFSLGLELEAGQRSLKQSQRQAEDLGRSRDRLASDLQKALKHHQLTDKHNQELCAALQQSSREQQERESALRERQAESLSLLEERDRSITQLKQALQDKERQLQERCEDQDTVSKPRDALLEKLRERIKERDRALERAVDERFVCVEEREAQVRRLQSALREKDRDQERLQSILSNNEETITSLDALLRSKDLELQRSCEALRNLQSLQGHEQETHTHALRERDTLITQLNNTLDTHRQETQELRALLLSQAQTGSSSVLAELQARLEVKERVFQELLSDRGHQAQLHQAHIQDLLSTISTRDHSLQDCSDRLSKVIDERTSQLQELRRQLSSRERELSELRRERESEGREEGERLQCLLKEKEAFIQELLKSREGVLRPSSPAGAAERLQDELQLMVKKEREAQRELSALRSSLVQLQQQALKQGARFEGSAQGAAPKDSLDHQSVLEQLISEYHCLNQALRTEKNLYQSLSQLHTGRDSQEKTQALHTELDSVQALRGQLEEVLARTRNTALALERGAGGPDGGPEGAGGGEWLRGASGATGGALSLTLHDQDTLSTG